MENKCEKLKMKHAWENTTSNIVYLTMPPQYPPHQETCQNCGLVKTFYESRKTWVEYSDGKERTEEFADGSITISTDDIIGGGITTLTPNAN